MRVEPSQGTVGNVVEPVVGSEDEEARLVELGSADDGHCFGKHQLVGHVSVQVHRAQERSLARVGVNLEKKDETTHECYITFISQMEMLKIKYRNFL